MIYTEIYEEDEFEDFKDDDDLGCNVDGVVLVISSD